MGERNELECIIDELLAIDATVSTLEQRRQTLHRRLAEIIETGGGIATPEPSVEFYDAELSIRWNGGRLKFREGAKRPYKLMKALYDAGEEGLTHEEAADIAFGDQLADIKQTVRTIREKVEMAGFPYDFENDGKILRFQTPSQY